MQSRDDDYRRKCAEMFLKGLRDLSNDEHEEAIKQFEEVIETQTKIKEQQANDRRSLAECYFLIGSISLKLYSERALLNLNWMLSDLNFSKEQFEHVITLMGEISAQERIDKDNRDLAYAYSALGKIYGKLNDPQKTLEANSQATTHFAYLQEDLIDDNYREMANIHRGSGDACRALEYWSRASMHYNKSISIWKKVRQSLSDEDIIELASCLHNAGTAIKKENELDLARASFLSEIEALGQVYAKNANTMALIYKAYSQLREICPNNDPEHAVFEFAAEVFGANFFNGATFDKLNSFLYSFNASASWQSARIRQSFVCLLELICATCRLSVFPSSQLKRYLQEQSHYEGLLKKVSDMKETRSSSVDNTLYELQDRVQRLEIDNQDLRTELADLRNKLSNLVPSPRFFQPVSRDSDELKNSSQTMAFTGK